MTDIFAQIENICINGKPMIVQQTCEKKFDTIQEAITYIESEVNPETDTIYNAQHYGIINSVVREYCGAKIDRSTLKKQRVLFRSIIKIKNSATKLAYLKKIYEIWYDKSKLTTWTWKNAFCNQKYEAYNMLDMSKKAFIKELRKKWLLDALPIISWTIAKDPDLLLLSSFYKLSDKEYNSDIEYTLPVYKDSKYNQELSKVIRNTTLKATDDAIKLLWENSILTNKEIKEIKKNLEITFNPWCGKNTGYHKINQYFDDKNKLVDVSLEKLQLNINLCKSYQYIDELSMNISKLLIHEIGHYVYNFKDQTTSSFENICRNKQSNKCQSDGFVTKYSQTNSEEDYAETFSRWSLAELKNDKRYVSFYKRWDSTISLPNFTIVWSWSTHGSPTEDIIYQKFSYFDRLLSKSTKTVSMK